MTEPSTAAEYVRMAEDCLDQSWGVDESQESLTLSVARAQVYATLAAVGVPPEPQADDHPTLVRVGGIAIGFLAAQETRDDGTIVYEIEPLPKWRGLPAPSGVTP